MLKQEEIEEISRANKIVQSAVHPDTGEIIPFYMRMSGFVIFNVPIVFAVLFAKNQTPTWNAAFQGVNQTYNAGMNYGNRNASSSYTLQDLGKGYGAALTSSVLIALFTRRLFAGSLKNLQGPSLTFANSFLNYFAGAFAGATNLVMMRYKELSEGIKV
jgi:sideroflexin-5